MISQLQTVLQQLLDTKPYRVTYAGWILYINYDNNFEMGIECEWAYKNEFDRILDQSIELEERTSLLVWKLVGKIVRKITFADEPPTLIMTFECGEKLEVYSDFSGYENWSLTDIKPGGMKIIVRGDEIIYFDEIQPVKLQMESKHNNRPG